MSFGRKTVPRMLALPAIVLSLAACTPVLTVDAPVNAADPACAQVMLRLPEEVNGRADRDTSAQSTEAWGDPAIAILRCGVTPPGPTTDPCVSVDGVDWISRSADEYWQFISYGRTPAVEVLVARDAVGGETVLGAVSPSVQVIEQTDKCVAAEDV